MRGAVPRLRTVIERNGPRGGPGQPCSVGRGSAFASDAIGLWNRASFHAKPGPLLRPMLSLDQSIFPRKTGSAFACDALVVLGRVPDEVEERPQRPRHKATPGVVQIRTWKAQPPGFENRFERAARM